MNTRKQADIGLGEAIAYFTRIGWSVSLPLTESQRYDLVVDNGEKLLRVEIKTTKYQRDGVYEALLKTCGGNQSWSGKITKFDRTKVDLLFVLADDGSAYCIPTDKLDAVTSLKLGQKYKTYCIRGGMADTLS